MVIKKQHNKQFVILLLPKTETICEYFLDILFFVCFWLIITNLIFNMENFTKMSVTLLIIIYFSSNFYPPIQYNEQNIRTLLN